MLEALEEQQFHKVERPPSSLGRSLRFGTWIGALSVLRSHDRIDEDAGVATVAAAGGVGERFERLWGRLTWPADASRPTASRRSVVVLGRLLQLAVRDEVVLDPERRARARQESLELRAGRCRLRFADLERRQALQRALGRVVIEVAR